MGLSDSSSASQYGALGMCHICQVAESRFVNKQYLHARACKVLSCPLLSSPHTTLLLQRSLAKLSLDLPCDSPLPSIMTGSGPLSGPLSLSLSLALSLSLSLFFLSPPAPPLSVNFFFLIISFFCSLLPFQHPPPSPFSIPTTTSLPRLPSLNL